MARKKDGKQDNDKKEGKEKGALEALSAILLSGSLGPEMKEKVAEVLNGDASFLAWWQRKTGESIVSTQNVLKAIGLIVAYAAYDHFDPLEGSKADNAAVLVAAIALGMLLLVPQSHDLGTHFRKFEATVFLLLQKVEGEEKKAEILKWVRSLSNRQEGRLAGLAGRLTETNEGKNTLLALLESERMRATIKELLGEDPEPKSLEESVKKAKEAIKKHWPEVKETARKIDLSISGALWKFDEWLGRKGVR